MVKATKFGVPFNHVPVSLKGYYKYKSGDTFTVSGKPVSGRKDMCDIYGVFYETDANLNTLDGTNIFTDPHIISVARISDAKETDDLFEGAVGSTLYIDEVELSYMH